jgi:O-antigen/teichoic acid export membrane protein
MIETIRRRARPSSVAPTSALTTFIPTSNLLMKFASRYFDAEHWRLAVGNMGWLFVERMVRLVVAVAVNAWVARYLGPSAFGDLAFVLATLAFFQAAANLGLDAIVVRELSLAPSRAGELIRTVLAARIASGLLAWAGATAAALLMTQGDTRLVALMALAGATVAFQSSEVVDLWFQSRSESRRTLFPRLAALLATSALKLALVQTAAPLWTFAAVVSVEAALLAAALWAAYRRCPAKGESRLRASRVQGLLRESWPILLSSVLVVAYMRADQLLIRHILGEHALGIYSAALTVSQIGHFVPALLSASLLPLIAAQGDDEPSLVRRRFVLIFRVYFVAALVLSCAVAAAAPLIIGVLYGAVYSGAANPLRIHVFTNVFIFLGMAHSLWISHSRQTGVRLAGTFAAGLVSLVGNWLLLPSFGLTGAALVAVAAQCLAAVLINALISWESFKMQVQAITFRRMDDGSKSARPTTAW